MQRLEIKLPVDRTFCGSLTLFSANGDIEVGPVPVCSKASDRLSSDHYNPSRTPLLPYGDTPIGMYRFSRLLSMREAEGVDIERYGRFGVVVFDPCGGDAVLAEAAGRFELWLHGGSGRTDQQLVSTAGSLRLRDDDQRLIMRALAKVSSVICELSVQPSLADRFGTVVEESRTDYEDPPALRQGRSVPSFQAALTRSLAFARNPGLLYLGEYDSGTYFSSVDQNYVIKNEGGVINSVYVPVPGDGYTVGAGINLSAQTSQGLLNMGADPATVNALSSVIGVYPPDGGTTAPGITLTTAQATSLSDVVMDSYFNTTGQDYSNACTFADFTDLPTQAQTAIADLQYNMGALSAAAPNLWSQVTSGQWQAAINNLEGINGQPAFSNQTALNNRAIADGKLIQQALTAGTLPTP
jgi:GH24 family phage-related lysozyme (muramidase)